MNKEKQIEEMAKELCDSTMCDLETYNNCRMPQGNCSRCKRVAKDLYNAGYRKASEIFEEIESKKLFVRDRIGNMRAVVLFEDIAKFKKKYTENKGE